MPSCAHRETEFLCAWISISFLCCQNTDTANKWPGLDKYVGNVILSAPGRGPCIKWHLGPISRLGEIKLQEQGSFLSSKSGPVQIFYISHNL